MHLLLFQFPTAESPESGPTFLRQLSLKASETADDDDGFLEILDGQNVCVSVGSLLYVVVHLGLFSSRDLSAVKQRTGLEEGRLLAACPLLPPTPFPDF